MYGKCECVWKNNGEMTGKACRHEYIYKYMYHIKSRNKEIEDAIFIKIIYFNIKLSIF